MPTFTIRFENKPQMAVEAARFEVENGALVFYRTPEGNTLGSMEEESFLAIKEWQEVEKR